MRSRSALAGQTQVAVPQGEGLHFAGSRSFPTPTTTRPALDGLPLPEPHALRYTINTQFASRGTALSVSSFASIRKGSMPFWKTPQNYLELEEELNGEYLHAGGEEATEFLLKRLRGCSVIEIGCGTGATLRRLCDQCSLVVGIDLSPKMLSHAALKSTASLVQAEASAVPFRSHLFDLVVAESVAGILDFGTMIREWVRLLKPGGTLALNDGLWKPGVSEADVERITNQCIDSFGHRIAPARRQTIEDWKAILTAEGLVEIQAYPAVSGPVLGRNRAARKGRRRAKLLKPLLWPALLHYRRRRLDLGSSLEYWIILGRKSKVGIRRDARSENAGP